MGFFSKFEGKMEDTFEGAVDRMAAAPISPVQIAKKAKKKMRREKMVGAGKQYAPTLYTVLVNPDDDERLFGYYPTLAGETETYLAAKAAEEGLVMDGQPLVRFMVDDGLRHGKFDVIAEAVSAPLIAQLRQEEMERYGIGGAPQAGYPENAGWNSDYAEIAPAYDVASPYDSSNAYDNDYASSAAPYDSYTPASGYDQDAYDPYAPSEESYAAYDSYNGSDDPYAPMDDYDAPAAQDVFDMNGSYGDVGTPAPSSRKPPLPYVPEDEIDYSIDYGEYTFDSQDFEDYRQNGPAATPVPNSARAAQSPRGSQLAASAAAGAAAASVAGAGAAGAAAASVAGARASAEAAGAAGVRAACANHSAAAPAPNTVVFAAGAAGATPQPSQGAVHARLVDTTNKRTYALATARLIIGREQSCDIVLPDINASRTHAELRFEPQGVWSITDLGSTNGTRVNGHEVSSQTLRPGDHLTIGMTNLVFELA